MISLANADFQECYQKLPETLQKATREACERFMANPGHPSLRFKKLAGYPNVWSVRVNDDYRVVGMRDGDTITWFFVGNHKSFDLRF
jgi:plasmid maintenance system killer protein